MRIQHWSKQVKPFKKNASKKTENYVCLSHLLHIFANMTGNCKFRAKHCGPRSLFDQEASKIFQQMTKAGNLKSF